MRLKQLYSVAIVLAILLCFDLTIQGISSQSIAIADSIKTVARINPEQIELIGLALIYSLWLVFRPAKPAYSYTNLLLSTPFLLVAWLSYPITKDIYLYLQYGLISLSGLNPYIVPAGSFNSNLSSLLDWSQSSPYGIVSLFFFVISAKAAQINLFLGVYLFKAICLGFHLLNSYLVWNFTKNSEIRHKITLAYLLNPALLFEQVVNAHIDVLICTILILLYQCLRVRSYLLALLLIWIGFLTKTLPIVWLPLISVLLVRQKRWQTLAIFALISLAIALVLQVTVFPTPEAWRSVLNPGVGARTAGSLHNLLGAVLMHSRMLSETSKATIQQLFRLITYAAFALYYSLTLIKIYRHNNPNDLIVQIGWVTFGLFVFATPWYQPWYATILIPIALLNGQARFFAIAALTVSLTSTVAYFCFNFDQTKAGILGSLIVMATAIGLLFLRSKLAASTRLSLPDPRFNSRS